ncbi:hypothetical protein AX16_005425 [Volvariella volvacea WC 439]|nr:hypothetical protein AX16_005425 [Volvariella volvacea WC 439]
MSGIAPGAIFLPHGHQPAFERPTIGYLWNITENAHDLGALEGLSIQTLPSPDRHPSPSQLLQGTAPPPQQPLQRVQIVQREPKYSGPGCYGFVVSVGRCPGPRMTDLLAGFEAVGKGEMLPAQVMDNAHAPVLQDCSWRLANWRVSLVEYAVMHNAKRIKSNEDARGSESFTTYEFVKRIVEGSCGILLRTCNLHKLEKLRLLGFTYYHDVWVPIIAEELP